ncbi:translation initiation factor IF-2 subunit beta [Candidatus Woesearchaeota archaeon]|nr:translation initiation factor IF-2 subunit beta [Candidatus Woesearchaeota archaeon]
MAVDMNYESLLKRAQELLPQKAVAAERLEVPKVLGHIQGNRTVVSNIHAIAGVIGRPIEHLLKYLLKELATSGQITKTALILDTKVPASRINEKVQQYLKDFVICPECKRPDTKLEKEANVMFVKCSACGARHAVKVRL